MITNTKTFDFYQDDSAVKVTPINGCVGENPTFIWVMYGPTEGGLSIDDVHILTKEEFLSKVLLYEEKWGLKLQMVLGDYFVELQKSI